MSTEKKSGSSTFAITDTAGKAQTVVIIQPNVSNSSLKTGELAITFSIIGIFALAIVFVPLGVIFGILAIKREQKGLGIVSIFLSFVAIALSPTFWAIVMAITNVKR